MQVRGPILPTQVDAGNPGLATPIKLKAPDISRAVGEELKAQREKEKGLQSAKVRGFGVFDTKPIKADPSISAALNTAMADQAASLMSKVASEPVYNDALVFLGSGIAPDLANQESVQKFDKAVRDLQGVQQTYGILSSIGQRSIDIRKEIKDRFDSEVANALTEELDGYLNPAEIIDLVAQGRVAEAADKYASFDAGSFVRQRQNLVQEIAKQNPYIVFENVLKREYAQGNSAEFEKWTIDSTADNEEIIKLNVGYVNPITGEFTQARSYTDLVTAEFLKGKRARNFDFAETKDGYDALYKATNLLLRKKAENQERSFPPTSVIQQAEQLSTGEGVATFVTKYVGASKDQASLDNPRNYVSSSALAFQVNPIGGKYPPFSLPATDPTLVFQYGTSPYDAARILRAPVPSSIDGRIIRILLLNDPGSPTGYREVFEVRTTPASEVRQNIGVSGLDVDVETATPTSGGEVVYVDVRANPTMHNEFLNRMSRSSLAQRDNFILEAGRFRKDESNRETKETIDTPRTPTPTTPSASSEDPRITQFKQTVAYKYASPAKQQELLRNKRKELGLE